MNIHHLGKLKVAPKGSDLKCCWDVNLVTCAVRPDSRERVTW